MDSQAIITAREKIPRALIHMVITQLKQCFSDLVIFCDKAYNSINPIFNTLFQLPARLICFNFTSVCYNYALRNVQFLSYQLFTSVEHFPAERICSQSKSGSSPHDHALILGFIDAHSLVPLVAPKPNWVHFLPLDLKGNRGGINLFSLDLLPCVHKERVSA